MPTIRFHDQTIHYDIVRGNRKKTVAIHVDADTVIIRVPRRLTEERIREFMEKKAPWICDRQTLIRADKLNRIGKNYVSGEPFPYLGKQYTLEVIKTADHETPVCKLRGSRLQVALPAILKGEAAKEAVKNTLIAWYREKADRKIRERVTPYAVKLGVCPASITIKDQKTQWGSCARSGALRFNWKIIMAPTSVLDYIIVHELCHLIHNHHQAQFWQKVQSVIPDCKASKDWLREHSILITGLT